MNAQILIYRYDYWICFMLIVIRSMLGGRSRLGYFSTPDKLDIRKRIEIKSYQLSNWRKKGKFFKNRDIFRKLWEFYIFFSANNLDKNVRLTFSAFSVQLLESSYNIYHIWFFLHFKTKSSETLMPNCH